MFRSLFCTRDIHSPELNHIGIQTYEEKGVYRVREVLEGYPAQLSGLRRGDVLLKADGNTFHPYLSFNNPIKKQVTLEIQRNGGKILRTVKPIYESPYYSFLNAMIKSKKITSFGSKKIGYVHL